MTTSDADMIAALRAMIARGAVEMTHGDRTIKFGSIREAADALARLEGGSNVNRPGYTPFALSRTTGASPR
jgi:hypothetical protein